MPAQIVIFPDSIIALNKEVRNHPNLRLRLSKYSESQLTEKLAEIATYCNVLVEGYFSDDALDDLCNLLIDKLRSKSTILIM
jgi:small ligand-binding sensory domain FIST